MHDARARSVMIVAAVAWGLGLVSAGQAQTVKTFTGAISDQWTINGNWSPSGVPNASDIWAQIDSRSTTGGLQEIFYASTNLTTAPVMSLGAISFLPTLTLSSGDSLSIQNRSTITKGTLKLFGIDTTIDGQARRIVLDNSSTLSNVNFTQTNAGQDFELNTSGVINVTADTQLISTPTILEAGGARSLTKIGLGLLSLSGTTAAASVYSGGFVMEAGIVQWTSSGSAAASPFGIGPLTLRGGTLRSTNEVSRSINVNIVLDGGATLGSTETGFTGNITINSAGGSRATTVESDSVVAIPAGLLTVWNQATSGSGGLTKQGPGTLRFSGLGGNVAHAGPTIVAAGTLVMDAAKTGSGTLTVESGGTLMGSGSIAGAATILAGGTLSPGASPGVLTFGGDLSLGGTTFMEIVGTDRGSQYDGVDVAGALAYGGTLVVDFAAASPDDTSFSLFSFDSQSGAFSAVTLQGAYQGSLQESEGVWTGSFGEQTVTFSAASGTLSIVPEPAALWLLVAAAAAGAAAGRRRLTSRRNRRLRPQRPGPQGG